MQRSRLFYWFSTLVPLTAFTILSFSVFFMSFQVGEILVLVLVTPL